MKSKISNLIRILISFGLLALLFWIMRDDILDMWQTVIAGDMGFILAGLALILVNVAMLAYRFKIIFLGEDLKINMREAFQLTTVGYFFNNFMPTAVGGDIVKAYYAAHGSDERIKAYASVFMDRFIGLYTFLLVAAAALAVDRGRFHLDAVRTLVFILIFLGIVGFVVATNRRVARFIGRSLKRLKVMDLGEKLGALYNIVHDYRNRLDVVLKSFAVSILGQSLYFTAVYLFFRSLGHEVNLGNIFLIMPVVTFVSMIPSLGGLGVREGAFVALFAGLTGKETAFAVSLMLLFGLFFISLIGGAIYLWWGLSGLRTGKVKDIINIEKEVEEREANI
ncbi:MAG: flippase-like domain-containing protein [Candidatus Omnitrophica bacterium]|nr:flippase-like domain-containing protein [Candidatus Omnitrophota bacterium]